MYDVNYFIDKFSSIPEEEWTTGIQQNDKGQRCALGHCLPIGLKKYSSYSVVGFFDQCDEMEALRELFINSNIMHPNAPSYHGIAAVNNGTHPDYQQFTPKTRILAALMDIKAEQEAVKEVEEIVCNPDIDLGKTVYASRVTVAQ